MADYRLVLRIPGAPPDTSVTARFGALSRAGVGSGVPVTGASIASGDPMGHWQVIGGVLCPSAVGDTANLNAGPYQLVLDDGQVCNITIEPNAWSVSTQAEWDAIIAQPAATLSGKTIFVRRLASGNYVSGVNGAATRLRRGDFGGLVICSDDPEAPAVFDKFVVRGARNLTFQGLDTVESGDTKFTFIAEAANFTSGISLIGNRIRGIPQDPHGNFTGGIGTGPNQFPNLDAIVFSGTAAWIGDLVVRNNHVTWCSRGINGAAAFGSVRISGNRFQYFFEDGINWNYGYADTPTFITDNVISHPMGKGRVDALKPHVDAIRLVGSSTATTDWTVYIARNRVWHGDSRGDIQNLLCSDMNGPSGDSGHFFIATVEGNAFCAETTQNLSIENAKNCVIRNNTVVREANTTGLSQKIMIGAGSTYSTDGGGHVIERNIAEAITYTGSPTLTDNVVMGTNGAIYPYDAVFDGPTFVPETVEDLMASFNMKAGGPADLAGEFGAGAVGSGAVTWATTIPGDDGVTNVSGAVPGDVLSVNVLGSATVNNINPAGWVAAVTFAGMSTGQTLTASRIRLTVESLGYDTTGAVTTVSRTVTGTAALRKPIPQTWVSGLSASVGDRCSYKSVTTRIYQAASSGVAGATPPTHTSGTVSDGSVLWTFIGTVRDSNPPQQPVEATVEGNAVVYVTLSDFIYASDTITAVEVQAGAYGASNASKASTSATNGSDLAYDRPFIAWLTEPYQLVGTTLRAEIAASHPYGRQGRMLSCVKFIVRDSLTGAVTATVTSMEQSEVVIGGNPVPVFGADIDISALADGACTVEVEAYPFVGNSPYRSTTHGFGATSFAVASTTLTANVAKRLPFRKDAAGTFGRLYAYVDPVSGNDATGVSSTDAATASASPFQTIQAAAGRATTGLQAASLSTFGRNNLANHVIRLKAGTYSNGFGAAMTSLTMGDVWLTIERDPLAAVGSAILAPSATATQRQGARRVKYRSLTIAGTTAAPVIDNVASSAVSNFAFESWFEGCSISGVSGSGQKPLSRAGLMWFMNCTLANMTTTGAENTATGLHTVAGCTISGTTQVPCANLIGNVWTTGAVPGVINTSRWAEGLGAQTNVDMGIAMANTWYACAANVSYPQQVVTSGAAWVQNLIEVSSGTTVKGGTHSGDGNTTPIGRLDYLMNSAPGEGMNVAYNDTGTGPSAFVQKRAFEKFNASNDRNCKGDFYDASPAADQYRVGNFACRYAVGWVGNAVFVATKAAPTPNNLAGEVIEERSFFAGTPAWTNDQSKTGGAGGNGDYRPTVTSSARNRVLASEQMLPFDLMGAPRRTDGTGAAGAFEWA